MIKLYTCMMNRCTSVTRYLSTRYWLCYPRPASIVKHQSNISVITPLNLRTCLTHYRSPWTSKNNLTTSTYSELSVTNDRVFSSTASVRSAVAPYKQDIWCAEWTGSLLRGSARQTPILADFRIPYQGKHKLLNIYVTWN